VRARTYVPLRYISRDMDLSRIGKLIWMHANREYFKIWRRGS
jgi:hypothetical protein